MRLVIALGLMFAATHEASSANLVKDSRVGSPVIRASGYQSLSGTTGERDANNGCLWLKLDSAPANAEGVVLESVWGSGPTSLSSMWHRNFSIYGAHVEVCPISRRSSREQSFTLTFRIRFLLDDGSLSAASLPTMISHRVKQDAPSSCTGFFLFALLGTGLLVLWMAFRKADGPLGRIRIAAAIGLVSVLFLSVTPALSWWHVDDDSSRYQAIECQLGDEVQCATYVPDAGPNPTSASVISSERRIELTNWVNSSLALRVGLILTMLLLLPGLIWLLVAPHVRPAQTAVVFGASAAAFTYLSTVCYLVTVPSWVSATSTAAISITLVTTTNMMIAAGMVVFWSLRLAREQSTAEIPKAISLSR